MDIQEIRTQIDRVDDQIVALYRQRLALVADVAQAKGDMGEAVNVPQREQAIVYRLTQDIDDDRIKLFVKELYGTVFTTSKAYQCALLHRTSATAERLKAIRAEGQIPFPASASVACQGVMGANSYTAATKLFPILNVTYFRTFEGVFGAVAKGLCRYGVLPIENSTAGSVNEVYDLMKKYDFHIVKSIRLKINHCLAARKGTLLADVRTVVSHPQALSQCSEFLKAGGYQSAVAENTAVAAKTLAQEGDNHTAVLCAEDCANLYGLEILARNVQNNSANYTRFIVIGKQLEVFAGSHKISVMTSLPHEPGSLNKILGRFASMGLDLTKLESRPLPDMPFAFMFYFDFEGNVFDDTIIALIAELENSTDDFTFLGSYQEMI